MSNITLRIFRSSCSSLTTIFVLLLLLLLPCFDNFMFVITLSCDVESRLNIKATQAAERVDGQEIEVLSKLCFES